MALTRLTRFAADLTSTCLRFSFFRDFMASQKLFSSSLSMTRLISAMGMKGTGIVGYFPLMGFGKSTKNSDLMLALHRPVKSSTSLHDLSFAFGMLSSSSVWSGLTRASSLSKDFGMGLLFVGDLPGVA